MSKVCIFNEKIVCSNCGECDNCDLVKGKICDNCGKCLEMEGIDTKAVRIDEVFDEPSTEEEKSINENNSQLDENINEEQELEFDLQDNNDEEYIDVLDLSDKIEYIDDIDDLSEILSTPDMKNKLMNEQFPGFLTFKSKN